MASRSAGAEIDGNASEHSGCIQQTNGLTAIEVALCVVLDHFTEQAIPWVGHDALGVISLTKKRDNASESRSRLAPS